MGQPKTDLESYALGEIDNEEVVSTDVSDDNTNDELDV